MPKSRSKNSAVQPRATSSVQTIVVFGISALVVAEVAWLVLLGMGWFPYWDSFELRAAIEAPSEKVVAEPVEEPVSPPEVQAEAMPEPKAALLPETTEPVAQPPVAVVDANEPALKPEPQKPVQLPKPNPKPKPVPLPEVVKPVVKPPVVVEVAAEPASKPTPPAVRKTAPPPRKPLPEPVPVEEPVFASEDDEIAAAVAAAVAEFPTGDEVEDEVAPPAPAPDLVRERASEMMKEATALAAAGKLEEADRELDRIQTMAPDFVDVYVARAKLYEQRDLLNDAKSQWKQVVMWAQDPLLREEAEQAQRRLAGEAIERTRAEIRVHEEQADAVALRRLSVGDVRQERFPKSADYDEMRLLRIELHRVPGSRPIDVKKVKVNVAFFDRGKTSGTLAKTRVVVTDDPITLNGAWRNDEKRTITAPYIVPRDFRRGETRDRGEAWTYYGYVVEVRYDGTLQDRSANRERLLKER